jgi:hypothetical protein
MIDLLREIAFYACALLALTLVGNLFIQLLLDIFKIKPFRHEDKPSVAGRLIGSLERIIIAIGILAGSWEVLVAVVALKQSRDTKKSMTGAKLSIFWSARWRAFCGRSRSQSSCWRLMSGVVLASLN